MEPGDHVTINFDTRPGSHPFLNRWVHATNNRSQAQGWFPIRFTGPRPAPGHVAQEADADAHQEDEWRPANTTGHMHGPEYSSDNMADGPRWARPANTTATATTGHQHGPATRSDMAADDPRTTESHHEGLTTLTGPPQPDAEAHDECKHYYNYPPMITAPEADADQEEEGRPANTSAAAATWRQTDHVQGRTAQSTWRQTAP